MSWGSQNDESPRDLYTAVLAEREWLRRKGEAGEQPEEPECRCPRSCWCQGGAA